MEMSQKTARMVMDITRRTYDLIGVDFAHTRIKPWPEMEDLANRYLADGQKVLDLGCGNGRILEALKKKRIDYFGIDGSEVLIKEARKKAEQWEIKKMGRVEIKFLDILNLADLGETSFDAVLMFASFNNIPSWKMRGKVLRETASIVKKGGYLIMTNWNLWRIDCRKKSVWRYKLRRQIDGGRLAGEELNALKDDFGFRDIMTFWQSRDGERSGGIYYRVFTRGELRKILKENGFSVIENYYSVGLKRCCWWNAKNIVTVAKKV